MQRTQIYLTAEERLAISRRAADAGVSQAELIRRLLDRALGLAPGPEDRLAAIDASAGLLAGSPDWPDWLAAVRGKGAGERLRELGL
jgi:hypothetical protein